MGFLLNLALTVQPSPSGGPTQAPPDPNSVTPGTLGFIITLFLAVATIFLIRDMIKRIRRVRYRQQVEEARLGTDGGDGTDGGLDPDGLDPDGLGPDGLNDDGARHPDGGRGSDRPGTGPVAGPNGKHGPGN